MIVCDTDNMEYIVHRSEKCPGFSKLQTYFEGKFYAFEFGDDITHSQWDSTDRTKMRNYTSSVEEFMELLVYQMDSLTTHSYIPMLQKVKVSKKTDIDQTECLILLDFANDVSPEEAHTKLIDSLKPNGYITCIYREYW